MDCSFCGCSETPDNRLVVGPNVSICARCVADAQRVLSEMPADNSVRVFRFDGSVEFVCADFKIENGKVTFEEKKDNSDG